MKVKVNNILLESETVVTAYDAIKEAELISREVIAASVNGETVDLSTPIKDGDTVSPLTFADEGGKRTFNHTASHVLAQAVKRLYPDAKLTILPKRKGRMCWSCLARRSSDQDIHSSQDAIPVAGCTEWC